MLVGYWKRFARQPRHAQWTDRIETWPCGSNSTISCKLQDYLHDFPVAYIYVNILYTYQGMYIFANFPVNNGREFLVEFCNYSGDKQFLYVCMCVPLDFNGGVGNCNVSFENEKSVTEQLIQYRRFLRWLKILLYHSQGNKRISSRKKWNFSAMRILKQILVVHCDSHRRTRRLCRRQKV